MSFQVGDKPYPIKYGCRTEEELLDWEYVAYQARSRTPVTDPEWLGVEELLLDLAWQRAMFFSERWSVIVVCALCMNVTEPRELTLPLRCSYCNTINVFIYQKEDHR